mgnify:CR=1 FL=1
MDKKNPQTNDDWLDEILGKRNVARELRADELAVAADGLAHPEEIDLERIVQETMAENWGEEEPSEIPGQQSIDDLDQGGFSRTVGAHNCRYAFPEFKHCLIGEGFEALHFKRF